MEFLNNKLAFLLESNLFLRLLDMVIYANPLAMLPQLYTAMVAPSVEGVSVGMYLIFVAIQVAISLQGIKVRSMSMFLSMAISALESIAIITIVLMRS